MIKFAGISNKNDSIVLYYSFQKGGCTFFKSVTSKDGFTFDGRSNYLILRDDKGKEDKNYSWKQLRITKQKDGYFALYKPDNKTDRGFFIATSKDLINFTKSGKLSGLEDDFAIVPEMKFRNRYVAYFGGKDIRLAYSGDLKNWKIEEEILLSPRPGLFDEGILSPATILNDANHILLIYYVKQREKDSVKYKIGAATFSKKNPLQLLSRTEEAVWEFPKNLKSDDIRPLGCTIKGDELMLYWILGVDNIYAVSCSLPFKHKRLRSKIFASLKRFANNPIIKPLSEHPWEARATFNSAAVYEDGKVHFVYRALGDRDLSVFGYASSKDGLNIDERSSAPIYIPTEPFETPGQKIYKKFEDHYVSGGGYGGVEDPRLTKVDGRFYMTYVAYDGANPPRVALTSIKEEDFLNKKWDKWERPKLISAPGMVNKNAVIFPEKINGKYVVFHRVFPNILIDYVDDLNFDKYLTGHYIISPRKHFWDSKKIGAGAPPIKTKEGWLFIYQAVGYDDPGRYKIGAMMLDLKDPTKVLYRCSKPLIAPDFDYENEGHKAGVVYPCGAVVKDNKLLVYYGGADTVICAASEDLDKFIKDLKYGQEPELRRVRRPILN